jgi:hypothetical protein
MAAAAKLDEKKKLFARAGLPDGFFSNHKSHFG